MFHWTIHLKGGPKKSYHAAVVVRHKLYSFGGYKNYLKISDQIEVHIFNTVSLRWRKLPPVTIGRGQSPIEVPFGRWGHTAELVEEIVYIWGGYPYCNVLYAFDVDTHSWFKPSISGSIPEARRRHSACVLEKVIYVYGGETQLTGYTNDMYKLDTTIMVWSLITTRDTAPPASYCHSAIIIGTKMFVFGGRGGQGDLNSNSVFDTETNCWLKTLSAQLLPEERSCHLAFAYNGELYVFGGWNGKRKQCFNDLWNFSPESFSWKQAETKGKGPCRMRGMCCCMVEGRIIIFGGFSYKAYHDDLYILDLSPSLKTLCKLSVIHYGLDKSELPHDIRWELKTMTTNSNKTK